MNHLFFFLYLLPSLVVAANPQETYQETRVAQSPSSSESMGDFDTDDGEDEDSCYYFYDVDLDSTWLDETTWPSKREDSWYNQLTR